MPTSTQTTTTTRSGLKVKTHVKAGPALTINHNETLVRPAGARFWSFTLWWLCAGVVLASASAAGAAQLTCPTATTLETLVACIVDYMPRKKTNGPDGYWPPSPQQLADYRTVVNQMLHRQCDATLPRSLAANLQRRMFTDSQNGKSYCLLMETELATTGKVAKGWGTFIVADRADREISHQAPHPIADSKTDKQAIGLFKSTNARSFLMCGAHREANGTTGSCQDDAQKQKYNGAADCAHNRDNMFTMANLELDAFYRASPWTAIQWHGMGTDKCLGVDVYMSQGINDAPANFSTLSMLKQLITVDQPWAVHDPGDLSPTGTHVCDRPGTDNVQGRLLNGMPDSTVCDLDMDATASVGDKFIHIEQKDDCPSTNPSITSCRDAAAWSQAVLDTW